jgi:hypothetical protein
MRPHQMVPLGDHPSDGTIQIDMYDDLLILTVSLPIKENSLPWSPDTLGGRLLDAFRSLLDVWEVEG